MSDYPMLISNKLHSFRNFVLQKSYFIRIQRGKIVKKRGKIVHCRIYTFKLTYVKTLYGLNVVILSRFLES